MLGLFGWWLLVGLLDFIVAVFKVVCVDWLQVWALFLVGCLREVFVVRIGAWMIVFCC